MKRSTESETDKKNPEPSGSGINPPMMVEETNGACHCMLDANIPIILLRCNN
jgi:hypothetical protein